MRFKILLLVFLAFFSKASATEVNGSFKDECKYLKNQIEEDIRFMAKQYYSEFEAAAIIDKGGLKKMLDYYMTLCD